MLRIHMLADERTPPKASASAADSSTVIDYQRAPPHSVRVCVFPWISSSSLDR